MRRFVVYRLAEPEPVVETIDSDVEIGRCVSELDIQAVERLTYFKRSYSTGQLTAWQTKANDQLVGGMWAAAEAFDENELGVRLLLAKEQAWLFAALVSNDVRGKGIYSRLLPIVMRDLAEQGFDDQLVAVNPDNLASNRIHKRLSSSTVGHVLAIRFLKITACWTWGGIKKQRTVSWNSTERPIEIYLDDP